MTKYNHLTEKDIAEAQDINDIMNTLDMSAKQLVLVYARGLSDMQKVTEKQTAQSLGARQKGAVYGQINFKKEETATSR